MYAVPSKLLTSTLILFSLMLANAQAAEQPPLTHNLTPVKSTAKAPSMRLQNMDDEIVDIAELQGKVIVVNFWATWCPPCRREMGSLERLHLATEDKNVVVLAVNVGEDIDTVFSFMGTVEPSPSFPILFDTESDVMESWKVRGLPTTYIVDPSGVIKYRAVGGREFDHPELLKNVIALTNKS